jgi:hypothetical protein
LVCRPDVLGSSSASRRRNSWDVDEGGVSLDSNGPRGSHRAEGARQTYPPHHRVAPLHVWMLSTHSVRCSQLDVLQGMLVVMLLVILVVVVVVVVVVVTAVVEQGGGVGLDCGWHVS